MQDFLGNLPAPLTATSRQFFTIWNAWRGMRALPRRADIRLEALGPLADCFLLLEIRDRETMRFVDAGARVVDYLGLDVVGGDYLDLTIPENRRLRQQLTLEQLLQPCGSVVYYWLGYGAAGLLPLEIAAAPVCADGTDIAQYIIGCCTPLIRQEPRGIPDPESWRIGEGMRFIDLGFGIPPANPATPRHMPPAF
jgi:hypothetical protein